MHFALLGDHPDGLDLARAIASSGRHELYMYCGAAAGLQHLRRHGVNPQVVADAEELLADAEQDAVIVASAPDLRPIHLRRAMQSECHVLCVQPADSSPVAACEAAMIQADTNRVLLPILPMTLHSALSRFRELMRVGPAPRMLEMEIWSTEEVLLETAKPSLPGWDALRFLGGEIVELFAHAPAGELKAGEPLLVSGRFANGILLQASYVPNQAEGRWRASAVSTTGRAVLEFTHGWPGPAWLTWTDAEGVSRSETWEHFHPYAALLERFEQAVDASVLRKPTPGQPAEESLTKSPPLLGWLDAVRALELDDAARRSAQYGRSSTLDLQEATEEASFKGTMTLIGCSLIWLAVLVLILAVWVPWLAWFIVPVLAVFLGLQALRWIVPAKQAK